MKRHILTYLIILTSIIFTCGQTNKVLCDCPKTPKFATTKSDTTFNLSIGKTIVLCGYRNVERTPVTFSEFILAVCGQDTVIDFWGAIKECRLYTKKDTLYVEELKFLPIGKHLELEWTIWTIEKIFFTETKVNRKLTINKNLRKYNQKEIQSVLSEFENYKGDKDFEESHLPDKLFIAFISGNKIARKYFNDAKDKIHLDTISLETYDDLQKMMKLWDRQE